MASPSFSFTGFSVKTLLDKNWNKLDTYVKLAIAIAVSQVISNDELVQIISVPITKLLLDVAHYYLFDVKQPSTSVQIDLDK